MSREARKSFKKSLRELSNSIERTRNVNILAQAPRKSLKKAVQEKKIESPKILRKQESKKDDESNLIAKFYDSYERIKPTPVKIERRSYCENRHAGSSTGSESARSFATFEKKGKKVRRVSTYRKQMEELYYHIKS